MKRTRTIFTKSQGIQRKNYLVDAEGKILGRLAAKLAVYLRGKHKPIFTPQTDCGDNIVVVNAEKICVTGKKLKDKFYFTHSGYPGGDKMISLEKKLAAKPAEVIRMAVKGMLPHNRLSDKVIKKLKIFSGDRPEFKKWERLEV